MMDFKIVFTDRYWGTRPIGSPQMTKRFKGKVYLDGIVTGRKVILKYMDKVSQFRYKIYQWKGAPENTWSLMESGDQTAAWYVNKKRAENAESDDTGTPRATSQ